MRIFKYEFMYLLHLWQLSIYRDRDLLFGDNLLSAKLKLIIIYLLLLRHNEFYMFKNRECASI